MNQDEINLFEEEWNNGLKPIIDELTLNVSTMTFDESSNKNPPISRQDMANGYSIVYKMCTQRAPFNWSEKLYDCYIVTVENFVTKFVPVVVGKNGSQLLIELVLLWKKYNFMIKYLIYIFGYLDKYHIRYHVLPSLNEAGIDAFRNIVFVESKDSVVTAVCDIIQEGRKGVAVDWLLLNDTILLVGVMPSDIRVTIEDFIINSTREHYSKKVIIWRNLSTTEYLIEVDRAFEDEIKIVRGSETEAKLFSLLAEVTRAEHRLSALLQNGQSGFEALLAAGEVSQLNRIFRLFSRFPNQVVPMSEIFKAHVKARGMALIEKRELRITEMMKDEGEHNENFLFVRDLMNLHRRFQSMTDGLSSGHFRQALYDSFVEIVINESKDSVVTAVCDIIQEGRKGVAVDWLLLNDTILLVGAMPSDIRVTIEDFIINSTREHYSKKVILWRNLSTKEYLIEVDRAFEDEIKIVRGSETEAKLFSLLAEVTRAEHRLSDLLQNGQSGFEALLAAGEVSEINRIFRLFSRFPDQVVPMSEIFKAHVKARGMALIEKRKLRITEMMKDEGENNENFLFVRDLMNLHRRFQSMTDGLSSGHFQQALYDSFVEIVNMRVGKSSNREVVTAFCDEILKTDGNAQKFVKDGTVDLETEEVIERVVGLFSYLADNDLFEKDLRSKLSNSILDQLQTAREADINRLSLKNHVYFFQKLCKGSLEVYESDFEDAFLSSSREHYNDKASQWQDLSNLQYLIKVENALQDEKRMATDFLKSGTEWKLLSIVEQVTLEHRLSDLLQNDQSGFKALLAVGEVNELNRMFRLFSRFPNQVALMSEIFKAHVKALGMALNTGNTESISELSRLYDEFLQMIKEQFSGNGLFLKTLDDSFVDIVNKQEGEYSNSELLSTYCDKILSTTVSVEKNDELEHAIRYLSFLNDKDIFADIYQNQLARRLLSQVNLSTERERIMIEEFKQSCGGQFTAKMERMLYDLSIGADYQTNFKSYCHELGPDIGPNIIEFGVRVLTRSSWPSHNMVDVTLPQVMIQCIQAVSDFHNEKGPGNRRLTWAHSYGYGTIKAAIGKKCYDLQLTTLQMAALCQFNQGGSHSFKDLLKDLNVSEIILQKILHSLACGEVRILKKSNYNGVENDMTIETTDIFEINENFSSPKRFLRIPMAIFDAPHNARKVDQDRSIFIEAAIVRIMKAKTILTHPELVGELQSESIVSPVDPQITKAIIGSLIDREFIKRDDHDEAKYRYVA